MDLTSTLRDLSQQQATGRLVVRFPKTLASVYLVTGEIIHATLGVNRGSEALAMILQMVPLRGEFRANLTAPETTIGSPLESLLALYAPQQEGAEQGASTSPPPTSSQGHGPQTPQKGPANASQPPLAGEKVSEDVPEDKVSGDARPGDSKQAGVVPAGFTEDLTRTLVYLMGPIGTIILEDAQADLNLGDALPKSEVGALLGEITQQLRVPERQRDFQREAAVLLARYNLV